MGKWFVPTAGDEERTDALAYAKKKGQTLWHLRDVEGFSRFYVGDCLPKWVAADVQAGKTHGLKIWYP